MGRGRGLARPDQLDAAPSASESPRHVGAGGGGCRRRGGVGRWLDDSAERMVAIDGAATIARRTTPAVVPPTRPAPARPTAVPRPQGPAVAASRPPAPLPTKPPVAPAVTPSQSTSPPTVVKAPACVTSGRAGDAAAGAGGNRPEAISGFDVGGRDGGAPTGGDESTGSRRGASGRPRATPPPVPAAIVPKPSAASTSAVATVAPRQPAVTKAPSAAPPVARATPPPVPAAIGRSHQRLRRRRSRRWRPHRR